MNAFARFLCGFAMGFFLSDIFTHSVVSDPWVAAAIAGFFFTTAVCLIALDDGL